MQTQPKNIRLHRKSRELELEFDSGKQFRIACELLRVYSPSAEVRGHSVDQQKLQTGKKHVNISSIEFSGNYAIKIVFDDGHDSGLYSWDYLIDLGERSDHYWNEYLMKLKAANASRLPTIQAGQRA
ncbi:MAG: DUF971 domain-containing protein [Pseudomonadales bacterium]|nr:DUF971 domain-containing protein [Pseudomonadales bacterium]